MNNEFTMEIIWHNCLTCPPEERFDRTLYITNGQNIRTASYSKEGWYVYYMCDYIHEEVLHEYWWANIEETIQNELRFKG